MNRPDIIRRLAHDIEQSLRNCGLTKWLSRTQREKAAEACLASFEEMWKTDELPS